MNDSREQNGDAIRGMVRDALQRQLGGAPVSVPAPDSEQVADESLKSVITESDVRDLAAGATLLIREGAIVTPAARDLIAERGVVVQSRGSRSAIAQGRIIAVGADHGGFEMKERLKQFLDELGCRHRDFGTFSGDAVDYPDYAHAVARAVADGGCDLGIIIDGAGIGSCMAANKVPGVRAAMCHDESTARNSREHNYANVLTLGGKMISAGAMREIVRAWLTTPEGEERHGRRVAKIMAIEKQYLR